MTKSIRAALALSAASLVVLTSCTSADKTAAPAPAQSAAKPAAAVEEPLRVEESAQVRVTAKVKAIDYATREVTLEDAAGHTASVVAGPRVQRLNEVRVGDSVSAEYEITVTAERRAATAEESANPISIVEISSRSPQGTDPAAGVTRGVKVVTTVEAVDLGKMLVTLKGPMGDTTAVRARNPENVKKLHVGDTIVITYVKATAVSVTKGS